MFKKQNIHKYLGKKIKRFEEDGVLFEDDSKLESDFTMFIPAGAGHEIVTASDLPTNVACKTGPRRRSHGKEHRFQHRRTR